MGRECVRFKKKKKKEEEKGKKGVESHPKKKAWKKTVRHYRFGKLGEIIQIYSLK